MKQARLGWRLRPALLAGAFFLIAAAPPVEFVPVGPRFEAGAAEYRAIWRAEGPRIVAAIEAATGIPFPDAPIEAFVSDGPPMTAFDGRSMRLKAGYSPEYKKAVLVHEMGHRLALTLPRPQGADDHRLLYLFLYDVWAELYGRDFAERMVAIERRIPGPYDYDAAWRWALAQSPAQRRARLRAVAARTRPRLEVADLIGSGQ